MKFVSFEDTTGIYETVSFPKVYHQFCHMLNEMRPYFTALTLTVHWIEFLDRHNHGNKLLLRSKRFQVIMPDISPAHRHGEPQHFNMILHNHRFQVWT